MCGAQLAAVEVVPEEVRKTVTVVFSDLKGSTPLAERLDTETLREVLNQYFNTMRAVLERHGGTVEKYIGDAIMAVFGLPQLHEDDALRAVRAAAEMQEELVGLNARFEEIYGVRLENRTGVNTGEVVAGDVSVGHRLVTGDTVNVAARLEQNAPTMEILLGETDVPTGEGRRRCRARGAAGAQGQVRADARLSPDLRRRARGGRRPPAGRPDGRARGGARACSPTRSRERSRPARARSSRWSPRPGPGKSRLLQEFVALVRRPDAPRTVPLLRGGPDVLAARRDRPERCRDRQRRPVGRGAGEARRAPRRRTVATSRIGSRGRSASPPPTTRWRRRSGRPVGSSSCSPTDEPLIVLIDDIHWAERTFLDLLTSVATTITDVPVVLACSARPDLFDAHPEWGEEAEHRRVLVLQPLSEDESAEVAANLLGTTELDAAVRAKIVEAAEGNPLFVEQMLSMLLDDGILERDDRGRWVLDPRGRRDHGPADDPGAPVRSPRPARSDRPGRGRAGGGDRPGVLPRRRRGPLPRRGPPARGREPAEPHAPRARDAARIELRRAGGLPVHAHPDPGGRVPRPPEAHARRPARPLHRLARAGRVRSGPRVRGDPRLPPGAGVLHAPAAHAERRKVWQIGVRGSGYLSSAGRRALARGDIPAAAGLLQRAATLLPPGHPERPRLRLDAAEALTEQGRFDEAGAMLHAAIDEAHELSDRVLEATAQIQELELLYTVDPEAVEPTIVAGVESHLPELEALEAHDGLARAWRLIMFVREMGLQWGESEAAAQLTLDHATPRGQPADGRPGDPLARLLRPQRPHAGAGGDRPMPRAARGGRAATASRRRCSKRRSRTSRRCAATWRSRARSTERAGPSSKSSAGRSSRRRRRSTPGPSRCSRATSRPPRPSSDATSTPSSGWVRRTTSRRPPRSSPRCSTGRETSRAPRSTRGSARSWPRTTTSPRSSAGGAFARKILASRGEAAEGEKLAREAVAMIQASDDLNSQGEALIDLAEVLRLARPQRRSGGDGARCARPVRSEGQHGLGRARAGDGAGAGVGERQLTTIRPHIPEQTPFTTLPWMVQK